MGIASRIAKKAAVLAATGGAVGVLAYNEQLLTNWVMSGVNGSLPLVINKTFLEENNGDPRIFKWLVTGWDLIPIGKGKLIIRVGAGMVANRSLDALMDTYMGPDHPSRHDDEVIVATFNDSNQWKYTNPWFLSASNLENEGYLQYGAYFIHQSIAELIIGEIQRGIDVGKAVEIYLQKPEILRFVTLAQIEVWLNHACKALDCMALKPAMLDFVRLEAAPRASGSSELDALSVSPSGDYRGLYQMGKSAWETASDRINNLPSYDVGVFDPEWNTYAAVAFNLANVQSLQARPKLANLPITVATLYVMHNQGATGGYKVMAGLRGIEGSQSKFAIPLIKQAQTEYLAHVRAKVTPSRPISTS
jgi:hypothetical protein